MIYWLDGWLGCVGSIDRLIRLKTEEIGNSGSK